MTTETAKHTPGGIHLHSMTWEAHDGSPEVAVVLDQDDLYLGRVRYGTVEQKANAARLALCWNTHDELVEALARLIDTAGVLRDRAGAGGLAAVTADDYLPFANAHSHALAILAKATP